MRDTYTAVLVRGDTWSSPGNATEPYEAAWAGEAIFFVRVLEVAQAGPAATARVQISPDGIRWVDEGASCGVEAVAESLAFIRVREFGGWLRLLIDVPAPTALNLVVTLAPKS